MWCSVVVGLLWWRVHAAVSLVCLSVGLIVLMFDCGGDGVGRGGNRGAVGTIPALGLLTWRCTCPPMVMKSVFFEEITFFLFFCFSFGVILNLVC